MNHKIVCWGDYAIPVPVEANWMAMDGDGSWFWYVDKPATSMYSKFWGNTYAADHDGMARKVYNPPEPGPWTEQLYWIGD